ncbi:phosphatidylinositol transfer protein beta isoform isoform X2 [Protobothrops mucrosquamatus]|uniref:phosphatidylinositol transfer protein beta isoform isoform X2 n=1 Tax=Protobothrops mucrosquamatus TaxID=103944 RepID=UPI00077583AB|nr:phosphatidylinositol transfer protein beta isoform isoform X2 [Protobothrops mucrosquamatus]
MVLVKEFRVVLPCSVEEYQVGQLFSVAEASKNNTGGGEGIEVLKNEPYQHEGEQGQYTHKIYHLQSKVPGFIKMFAPEGSLVVHERAWNAYPYCRTVITNEYMKDDFFVKIETWHKPDLGEQENRELANNEDCPHMCAYKLVTVKFRWWGLQGRVEKFIQKQERRLFTNFHRQLFCWLDKWVDLSMADIRRMEDETQKELDEIRQKGTVRGMTVGDE